MMTKPRHSRVLASSNHSLSPPPCPRHFKEETQATFSGAHGVRTHGRTCAVPSAQGLAHRTSEEHLTSLLGNVPRACDLAWNAALRARHGLAVLAPVHLPDLSSCPSCSALSDPVLLTSLLSSNTPAPPASGPLC